MEATRRLKVVKIDNLTFTVAEMNMRESKEHVRKSRDLVARTEDLAKKDPPEAVPVEEWENRTIKTVVQSLNAAKKQVEPNVGDTELWTEENILDSIGRGTLSKLYDAVLTVSGLMAEKQEGAPGEATAV